jgi:8-oxo-dGTP pyrophosphatase MutT (NUDIX family)
VTPAEIRARFAAGPVADFPDNMGRGWTTGLAADAIREAAVLVPIVLHPAPAVLLTLRSARLNAHAGQVSFPGGRIEPGETAEQAALRETEEETGLGQDLAAVLGRLPQHLTGTGYRITPVVGLLPPPLLLRPHPGEVEEVFELPLSVVLDPAAPERRSAEWKGARRDFWVWPHERHYIWGATAAILVNLARVLRAEAASPSESLVDGRAAGGGV